MSVVIELPRACRTGAVALLAGALLTSCAAEPTAPQSPATAAASPAPESSAPSVELPWPARTASDAAALQAAVDGGAQPWLLDPSEVAIAYAAAAHGWHDAEAYPGPDGTTVDVRNAEGARITLSLAQPGRTGDDGIWVVTKQS